MSTARYLIGDVFEKLAEIPDGSVDCLITSPPFLALRSYLPAGHPLKAKEIGSEPTPAAFLDTLLALTAEWRRVLAPHGSICVELGDTYAGSGGAGGDYSDDGLRAGQAKFKQQYPRDRGWQGSEPKEINGVRIRPAAGPGWPLDKSLSLIPTLYPASLAYGRNLLNPDHQIEPWRIRNLLVWARPNPPVGALGDKFRPATSYVTVATVARDRWFDLDAVRGPGSDNTHARLAKGVDSRPTNGKKAENPNNNFGSMNEVETAGAPPLDWQDDRNWQPLIDLPTAPYKGAHYATFPPELPRRLIEAMCPRQVCTTCGEPRRRVVEHGELEATPQARITAWDRGKQDEDPDNMAAHLRRDGFIPNHVRPTTTLGWTDCGHDTWRNGVVLDPFAGSGTTLAVATGCGRDAIGIDLDDRNLDLARERVGMFLEVA